VLSPEEIHVAADRYQSWLAYVTGTVVSVDTIFMALPKGGVSLQRKACEAKLGPLRQIQDRKSNQGI
jgi:hypothetical protein